MSKLSEAVKYYDSSDSEKEREYAFFLMQMDQSIGTKNAEALFKQATKQGKFIGFKSDKSLVDGGEYIIVDVLPF